MFSMPLRSLSVEKMSPVVMPNSGFISTSGVRNSFTPVKFMLRRWYSLPSSTGSVISAVIPGILVGLPDALLVLFELGPVEGGGEDALEISRVRHSDAFGVLHVADHPKVVLFGVAGDLDVAHFHLGAFIDHERNLQRRGRDLLDLRIHRGVLPAALRQKFLEHQ